MSKIVFLTWVAGLAAAVTCAAEPIVAPEPKAGSPADSALEAVTPEGWNVGAGYSLERRSLLLGGAVHDFSDWRSTVWLGYKPVRWLAVEAGAGASRGKLDGDKGELGLDWLARVRFNLAEYVIERSPVLGKQQSVRLGGVLSYEASESNDATADFAWRELLASPTVSYNVNLRGPGNWHPYDAVATGLRLGLLFSRIEGERGADDLQENRNFGLSAGAYLQFSGGSVLDVDLRTYGSDDQVLVFALTYNL